MMAAGEEPSDGVWRPERVSVSAAGAVAAFLVEATRAGDRDRAGIWLGTLDDQPARLSDQLPLTNLAFGPDGALAYALAGESTNRVVVHDASGKAVYRQDVSGFPEVVAWTPGGALLLLVAEPGADTSSLASGKPLAPNAPTTWSTREPAGWRRVWRLDPRSGESVPMSPPYCTVWQFAVVDDERIVAIASDDPTEAGWYRAALTMLGPSRRENLVTSPWQLSCPTVSPEGTRVAFLEGWTSDRGLDTGDVRIVDLAGGTVVPVEQFGVDATWLRWTDDGRLWFAGWQGLGTAWGWLDAAGDPHVRHVAAGCINSRWHPEVVPLPDGRALTVRSTEHEPPEVVFLAPDGSVAPWTDLNAEVARERTFVLSEVRWTHGDVQLDGLLALPRDADGPCPLVVDIHGGPSLAYHHAWYQTWAETLTPAGYGLLLPNPYGGPGRGQAFARQNLGDPCGVEYEQILAGVRHCVEEGLADGDQVAVMGASYGGYLAAWALARGEVFRGGVVIAGMSNLISCWGAANNAPFYEHLCLGPPSAARDLYLDRSPISIVSTRSLPALILHGELDQCVPVGQARELFTALDAAGAEAELVVYPGEGHQTQSIAHLHDQRRRILAFLTRVFGDTKGSSA